MSLKFYYLSREILDILSGMTKALKFLMILIIALPFLAAVTTALFVLAVLSTYGPKDDATLIMAIPEKIGIEKVIDKSSDIWDGSCMAFVFQISDATATEIKSQDLAFFDDTTLRSRSEGPDKIYASRFLEPWSKGPIPEYKDFTTAVRCSNISDQLKKKAEKAAMDHDTFHTKYEYEQTETLYLLDPQAQLLFITHYH